jgi:hypothetical protein
VLKINGVNVATPKSFSVTISDLDGESNRNAKGELIRDRIAVKRKLSCEWPPLTMGQISTILTAVQGVFFTVEYPDPQIGGLTTKTFYVGDREAPVYRRQPNGDYLWEKLSMDFIEK